MGETYAYTPAIWPPLVAAGFLVAIGNSARKRCDVPGGNTYEDVGAKLTLSEVAVRYRISEIIDLPHLENRSQVIAYAGKLAMEDSGRH